VSDEPLEPLSYLEHFARRVLQDAMTSATAAYWRRRADTLEAAAPQPGDYRGHATDEELEEARTRCRAVAAACRAHADVILAGGPEPISPDVVDTFREAEDRIARHPIEPLEDPELTCQSCHVIIDT
jgi:hypothetical protein